jgi:(2Fe-2S) ferredoxin
MKPYRHHIFVCLGKRCLKKGAEELLDTLKDRIHEEGLAEEVRLSRSGCVKVCKETHEEGEYSPVVIVYPEGVWYKNVTTADLDDIINVHIRGGHVVERLLHFRLTG